MAFTFNSKTFKPSGNRQDDASYAGPDKTVTDKDDIKLTRVLPKASPTFSGVGRALVSLNRTVALTDALTPKGELVMKVEFSVPVGTAEADLTEALADLAALAAASSLGQLVKKLDPFIA
jgi:hypothetical protein